MPIANDPITNVLALKALAWNYGEGTFISPSHKDFVWSRAGLQAAECPEGHPVPDENHTCGLYASYLLDIINNYTGQSAISPIFLVEASGRIAMHEFGFRSEEMTIRMVGMNDHAQGVYRLAAHQAADYFQVEVHPLEDLILLMDLHNVQLLSYYQPVSPALQHLTRNQILMLIQKRMASV